MTKAASLMSSVLVPQDKIDWNDTAVLTHRSQMADLKGIIAKRDPNKMRQAIKKVKHMFTYDYTCSYITSFVAKVRPLVALLVPSVWVSIILRALSRH